MIARRSRARLPWGSLVLFAALGVCASADARPEGDAPAPAPRASVAAVVPVVATPAPLAPGAMAIAYAGKLTQGGWLRGRVPPGAHGLTLDGRALPLAPDGSFFAAFDRDAGPSATLAVTLASGMGIATPLAIAPRAWEIERVDVGKRPGTAPSEEYERRRKVEVARITAARATDNGGDGWRQSFVWPAMGRLSGRFGAQRIYRGEPGAYHSGLDITGGTGTPFVAPADGVVILAADEPFTLEGHLLMIDHGMGLNSAFLHCSQLLVKEGDHVRQGQVIGRIGMTGRATGPHLHWSVRWQDRRLDPLLFTGPMP